MVMTIIMRMLTIMMMIPMWDEFYQLDHGHVHIIIMIMTTMMIITTMMITTTTMIITTMMITRTTMIITMMILICGG